MANPPSEDYDSNADEIIEELSQSSIMQHPERRLLDAILKDAIKEIKKKSKHANAALEWLENNDDDYYPWTFSFSRDVAPELKLDTQATRDALTGRKKPFKGIKKDRFKSELGKKKRRR